ncbi:MAG: discoidin domain-containing protein, partial [Clostridiales bacterium]|nr:discoidin domain-containing protein [Candidatus Coliplasma equi]
MKKLLAVLLAVLVIVPTALVLSASAADELVSKDKTYTITGCGKGYQAEGQWPSDYTADLTDGIASEDFNFGLTRDWFGFYYNEKAAASVVSAPDGVGSATIDLGSVQNVTKVRAHLENHVPNGFNCPTSLIVSVSKDGETFTDVASLDIKSTEIEENKVIIYWTEKSFDAVAAQYVRFTFTLQGVFAFVNELEVYADPNATPVEPEPKSDCEKGNHCVQTREVKDDVPGNASFNCAHGYEWKIDDVNGTIGGEDTTLIDNDEAYAGCNPNWAITLYLEKQSDGKYIALRDAIVTPGSAANAGITLGDGKVAFVVHSASSNPDDADKYPNWEAKVAAVAVKEGDLFEITDTAVKCLVPENDDPIVGVETIKVDGKIDEDGWKEDGWTEVNGDNSVYQTTPAEGINCPLNYKFQFRTGDGKLYGALIFDGEPNVVPTTEADGNGKGTFVRLWAFSKTQDEFKDAITYTHFFDIY